MFLVQTSFVLWPGGSVTRPFCAIFVRPEKLYSLIMLCLWRVDRVVNYHVLNCLQTGLESSQYVFMFLFTFQTELNSNISSVSSPVKATGSLSTTIPVCSDFRLCFILNGFISLCALHWY